MVLQELPHKAAPPSTWGSSCQLKIPVRRPTGAGLGFPCLGAGFTVSGAGKTPRSVQPGGTPASSAAARSAACPMIHRRFCGFCFLGKSPSGLPYLRKVRTDRRKPFKAAQVGSLTRELIAELELLRNQLAKTRKRDTAALLRLEAFSRTCR